MEIKLTFLTLTAAKKINRNWNNWSFSKSKEHNFVKTCPIVPKTKLDLDFSMINVPNFSSICITYAKKMNKNCWWTNQLTAPSQYAPLLQMYYPKEHASNDRLDMFLLLPHLFVFLWYMLLGIFGKLDHLRHDVWFFVTVGEIHKHRSCWI